MPEMVLQVVRLKEINFHLESVAVFIVLSFSKQKNLLLTILKQFHNTQRKNIHYFVALEQSKRLKSRNFVSLYFAFHFILFF
jgi:hypothetical protein